MKKKVKCLTVSESVLSTVDGNVERLTSDYINNALLVYSALLKGQFSGDNTGFTVFLPDKMQCFISK